MEKTMDKEFVSYEIALALKELGFNESCFGCYELSELRDYKKGLEVSWIMTLNTLNGYRIYDDETQMSAPLKQQVFKWFREKYKIRFIIQSSMSDLGEYFKLIFPNGETRSVAYPTYEEAENACIDKLIEIAKQQHHD
jgi:hypothetical protein